MYDVIAFDKCLCSFNLTKDLYSMGNYHHVFWCNENCDDNNYENNVTNDIFFQQQINLGQ